MTDDLDDLMCPHSAAGRPERFPAKACILAGECGCVYGAEWSRALRLADECEESARAWANEIDTRERAAAELRRLHAQAAQDEALLRQALERLEAVVGHFDPYMGDNECRPMENARYTIAALRGRLSKGA